MSQGKGMRLHAIVEGRVQGVGFRAFVIRQATALKLTGWVRNCWDGSVEVIAEGERSQLDHLLNALHQGPPAAMVTRVSAEWGEASGEFRSFHVKSSF